MRYFFCLLLCIVLLTHEGCLEASFELAPESRLPYWFTAPEGVARDQLRVKMDYYSTFSGGKYVFRFYEKGRFFKLDKVVVDLDTSHKNHRLQLNGQSARSTNSYPAYRAMLVNGVVDIFEHKQMEPLFYMTDDPAVWAELPKNTGK